VEGEVVRVLEEDAFFLSSHSDLFPRELKSVEVNFPRPSNPKVQDRLRLHGRPDAFDRYGKNIERLRLGVKR